MADRTLLVTLALGNTVMAVCMVYALIRTLRVITGRRVAPTMTDPRMAATHSAEAASEWIRARIARLSEPQSADEPQPPPPAGARSAPAPDLTSGSGGSDAG